jgi:hypothetical protein
MGLPPPPQPLQLKWPLEGVGPETHVHKVTNVLNDFDAGKSISRAIKITTSRAIKTTGTSTVITVLLYK